MGSLTGSFKGSFKDSFVDPFKGPFVGSFVDSFICSVGFFKVVAFASATACSRGTFGRPRSGKLSVKRLVLGFSELSELRRARGFPGVGIPAPVSTPRTTIGGGGGAEEGGVVASGGTASSTEVILAALCGTGDNKGVVETAGVEGIGRGTAGGGVGGWS